MMDTYFAGFGRKAQTELHGISPCYYKDFGLENCKDIQ